MATVPSADFREEPFESETAQQLLAMFIAEISELYPGWLPSRGPSAVAADFEPPNGRFVVGYVDDSPVACGGIKRLDGRVGEIKRLYVHPDRRRHGLARKLLDRLEAVAAMEGCEVVRLDTGGQQPHAMRLFETAGYRQIADYNGNPFAAYWFEKALRERP
jgi:GNAT superfamily N-acetyltransferase